MQGGKSIAALIVAAGEGTRAGQDLPKQYVPIHGRAVLAHAVDALAAHPAIDSIQVVIGAGQQSLYAEAIGARALPVPVTGGETRRESVIAGLEAIDADIVLIHDAARPFLPLAVIDRLLAALDRSDGSVPALPIADTLAWDQAGLLGDTVNRDALRRVQTPQTFRRADILAAHHAWDPARDATDDAQIARAHGLSVAIVDGDRKLEKLTYADDFTRQGAAMISRSASGYDVHALEAGSGVWLGGILIPHDRKLAGHSDADVAIHAIVDALLGTIGAGDIGSHFPPSDPQWRGAASEIFLTHAGDLVAGAGAIIDHVDLTIICETPKIGPHRDAIRARIAELLGIGIASVSVKATTTEGLGFTGRREGIAAQAIATIRVPDPYFLAE
jgi:2-C-methyl-D-erythritol 4-phosphate cytidylyltransferase/2-C-methyl-D-erythritol 2,4-cyclodiphosphate synthase